MDQERGIDKRGEDRDKLGRQLGREKESGGGKSGSNLRKSFLGDSRPVVAELLAHCFEWALAGMNENEISLYPVRLTPHESQ